jgi:hypothetical protein
MNALLSLVSANGVQAWTPAGALAGAAPASLASRLLAYCGWQALGPEPCGLVPTF